MKTSALSFKKLFTAFMVFAVIFSMTCPLSVKKAHALENTTLRIYNWEDYMDTDFILGNSDEGIVGAFIEYYKDTYGVDIDVEYMTFGTNEIMYNNMKMGTQYDLICPSDYMIEKIAKEGLAEKLDASKLTTYNSNVSPYLKNNVFDKISWKNGETTELLSEYSAGYMWGTMGFLYNVENVSEFDMTTWRCAWDVTYSNRLTIKDSVRDSYFMGVAYVYLGELTDLAEQYNDGAITLSEYQTKLKEIFNRSDDETIEKVEKSLTSLKKNIYGFEVDSGKSDVATGKIDVNFAWSGDAAYAMDQGDEVERELKYYVPMEGSNVWFDGWMIPKGGNTELAYEFINYLSKPEISARNMEYIGYTSAVLGGGAFDIEHEDDDGNAVLDHYDNMIDWMKQTYEVKEFAEFDGDDIDNLIYPNDISYLFGEATGTIVLYGAEENRQFMTTFPSEDVINRCTVMQYFEKEPNDKINEMWERVKGSTLPTYVIVLILVAIVLLILGILALKNKNAIYDFIDNIRNKNNKGGKNGKSKRKVVSKVEI